MDSSPGRYEFLEHTADAKFRAYGKDLGELFRNCACACFAIMTDIGKVKAKREISIEVTANRLESLLFDFLDELLFLLDTQSFLLHDCRSMHVTQHEDGICTLACTAVGDDYGPYDVSGGIKAVTYNEMYIKRKEKSYEAQVVVDV